ncbi:tetratricopeptide repeat protein [candidate division KSB1 bacterium]|nr:tetratricopeptide repeat protein [candidate division KSB1 bacterium]
MKKVSPLLLILLVTTQLQAKERLNFLVPAHPVLWGVETIYVDQTAKEDSFTVDFTDSLVCRLRRIEYFKIIDQDYLRKNFTGLFFDDSLTYAEKMQIAGDSIGVEIVLQCSIDNLILGPDEEGSDEVVARVWTGEYERDKFGKVLYDEIDGDTLRIKKFVNRKILKNYRYRRATIETSFQVSDFSTHALLMKEKICSKYDSGKIYESEYGSLRSYPEISDSLMIQAIEGVVAHIEPQYRVKKRHLQRDEGLIDEAVLYAIEGLYPEAIRTLLEAEYIYPEHASVYYNLGIIHEAIGKYHEAISYYKKAILIDDEDKLYRQALIELEKAAEQRRKLIQEGAE